MSAQPSAAGTELLNRLGRGMQRLGPERAARWGRALGDLRRLAAPREARTVARNLAWLGLDRLCASPPVAATYHAFGSFVVEFIQAQGLSAEAIAARWEWRGAEHLRELAAGRAGFILAGAHTGNWELLAALGPLLGRGVVAPAETQFHPLVSETLRRHKRRWGLTSISPGASMRPLASALHQGDLVALPLDGGTFHRGLSVELLGRQVRIAPGAARLALLSGRPILPVFARRTGFLSQRVSIGTPLWPGPARRAAQRRIDSGAGERNTTPSRLAAVILAQQAADQLGAHLRATPGQWCIFRPLEQEALPPESRGVRADHV
ncbi:MAG: lysophospholipid acyltransferase family protein [Candidatus Eisenbacteria sp.]|nr:lysophospholipid acyltransferase family protein [Candidatus Eisenbacteria bacterium]